MDESDRQLLRAVGRRIAEIRQTTGRTQEAFAALLGTSVKYVQQVEGGSQNLTLTSLAKLARLLDTTIVDLLSEPQSLEVNPGRPRKREV